MKKFDDLTKVGKYRRCNKVLEILYENVHSSNCLDRAVDELHGYEDTKEESYLNDCRNELDNVNDYRGYSNYCPLLKVRELLD